MATRTSGNTPARRTPALPQTGTTQHPRRHPDSSKITTSAQNQDSTSSQKQIPAHLKSTKTTTTNVSKQQSNRPTPSHTAHKPTPIRRSTFDDPSSHSTTRNTRVSPNPTLQKTGPARKPSSLYTKPVSSVKKRFIYVKKQDIGTSNTDSTTKEQFRSLPEKVEVSNTFDVPQPEQNMKDQGSIINEAKKEAIQVGSGNETKAVVSVQVDPEPIGNQQTTAENDKDVDLNNDKHDTTLAVKTEVTEENTSHVPEPVSNINQECSEARNINEINKSKTDGNVEDNLTSEVGEMNKEPAKGTVLSDKKEAVGTENEVRESKETEAAQEVGRETENVAAKTQVPKGKKGSVVSNDVIEETASKLREQRKNKVKALAGAFETVISLQEQK